MFFDSVKQPIERRNRIESNTMLYNYLNKDFYDVYSYFDKQKEHLYFVASIKEEKINHEGNLPPVITLSINKSLGIENDSNSKKEISNQLTFYCYLMDKEMTSTDQKRRHFYSSLPKDYSDVIKHSKDKDINNETFKRFTTDLDEVKTTPQNIQAKELSKDTKIHVYLHELNHYVSDDISSVVDLSLALETKNKIHQISSVNEFLNAFILGVPYAFTKKLAYTIKRECFDEKSLLILDLLVKNHVRCSEYLVIGGKKVGLLKEDFLKLLAYLEGSEIFFNDTKSYLKVMFPKTGKVTVSGKKVTTEPDIKVQNIKDDNTYQINSLYLTHKNYFVYIDIESDSMNIIQCKNNNECSLFAFMATQYLLNPEYLDELLSNNLGDNLALAETLDEADDFDFKILYRISLTVKGGQVRFNTSYYLNDEEIKDLRKINKNPLHKSKLEYFKKLLEESTLPDKGTGDMAELYVVKTTDFSKFQGIADVLIDENIANMEVDSKPKFQISAKYNIDWLDVKVASDVYAPEEINTILTAFRKKHKYVFINKRLVLLDNPDSSVAELAEINEDLELDEDVEGEVPVYNIFKFSALQQKEGEDSAITLDVDESVRNLLDEIKNYKKSNICDELENKSILREYQKDGIKWLHTLHKLGFSGILADDMGLGKTLQAISFLSLIYGSKPMLIIAPKSLVYNWEAEITKWAPQMKHQIVQGTKAGRAQIISVMNGFKRIYITSYDSLRMDINLYKNVHFGMVVLDEGQYIKNDTSLKTLAVKQLKTDGKLVISGTPIENSLDNLWSLFDFIMPKYFGKKADFLAKYQAALTDPEFEDPTVKEELLAKVTPFILRRTKEEVLPELPPKTEKIIKIEMSEQQHKYYESYRQAVVEEIENMPKRKAIQIIASLTNLRMLAVDPSAFFENYNEVSNKFNYTIDLVTSSIASGHKIIIFSFFVKALDKLKTLLEQQGIKSLTIKGEITAKNRLNIAETFNKNKDIKVLLVSLKAGGVGLNLTGADTVVHLDPWWNIAVENQATDRAHRIGQTRPVTIYKLVSYGTIEDKIIYLQEKKKELYNAVIRSGDDFISKMSEDDYKYLLS